jgi:hypothetical protein
VAAMQQVLPSALLPAWVVEEACPEVGGPWASGQAAYQATVRLAAKQAVMQTN